MMQKLYGTLAGVVLLLLTACRKEAPVTPPLPAAEATLIRNLVLINQTNVEKNKSYGPAAIKSLVTLEDGQLVLHVQTASDLPGIAGESVSLYIDGRHRGTNLAGGYTVGSTEPALRRIRYSYSVTETNSGTWGSITDSRNGVVFEGLLNITSHDNRRNLISGAYYVKARRLINDPTVQHSGGVIDPLNECDLSLSGTFSNLRLP